MASNKSPVADDLAALTSFQQRGGGSLDVKAKT